VISAKLFACSLVTAVKADTCTHLQYQTEEEASRHREYWDAPKPSYVELTTLADYQIRSYILHGHRNFRRLDRYA
jgi:hypothetical protein